MRVSKCWQNFHFWVNHPFNRLVDPKIKIFLNFFTLNSKPVWLLGRNFQSCNSKKSSSYDLCTTFQVFLCNTENLPFRKLLKYRVSYLNLRTKSVWFLNESFRPVLWTGLTDWVKRLDSEVMFMNWTWLFFPSQMPGCCVALHSDLTLFKATLNQTSEDP